MTSTCNRSTCHLGSKTVRFASLNGLALSLIVLFLAGCGKYMRPVPPEAVSPQAVESLGVQGSIEGVRLAWGAPINDRRGKELTDLRGFSVERKLLSERSDAVNEKLQYQELAFLPDRSIEALKAERDSLRAQQKPGHRAKIDPSLRSFEFVDRSVQPGQQYIYRIVPRNYYGDGAVQQYARVLFRGDSSEIVITQNDQVEDDLSRADLELGDDQE